VTFGRPLEPNVRRRTGLVAGDRISGGFGCVFRHIGSGSWNGSRTSHPDRGRRREIEELPMAEHDDPIVRKDSERSDSDVWPRERVYRDVSLGCQSDKAMIASRKPYGSIGSANDRIWKTGALCIECIKETRLAILVDATDAWHATGGVDEPESAIRGFRHHIDAVVELELGDLSFRRDPNDLDRPHW